MKKQTSAVILTSAVLAALFVFVFGGTPAVLAPVIPALAAPAPAVKEVAERLIIPAIGVNAPIKGMGLEANGKMAVPNNFKEVGWYKLGTKPGEIGSAVMGAHVDNGAFIPGVFKNLKKLKEGDEIFVTDENEEKIIFKVAYVKIFTPNEKDTTEIFAQNDKARLNLITCHGKWIPSLDTYSQRLIVFAEKVS